MKKTSEQISSVPLPPSSQVAEQRYIQLLESIVNLTQHLLEPASLEQTMNRVLAKIGALTGVDQMYFLGVGRIDASKAIPSTSCQPRLDLFAWSRHSPHRNHCPGQWLKSSFGQQDCHPVWKHLREGRSLHGTIEAMDADIAMCLQQEKVQSILLLPVIQQEKVMGVLGFETRDGLQDWSDRELLALKQLKQILGAALRQSQLESRLSYYAFHDPLTDLPNRALLLNRLEQCIKRKARYPEHAFAVLFLDLDRFKPINDRLGHEIGDRLLVQVAQRISGCVRPCDTVARLGGDEFVVLLDEILDLADAESVIDRVRSELTRRFEIDGNDLHIDVSIGIALSSLEFESGEAILQKADLAMYRAKKSGQGSYRVFESSMHSQMVRRSETESDMHLALQNHEFDVYYQPIIDVTTGQIQGFEALARWNHPLLGLLTPGYFIPIAEETGMIKALGLQVLRSACQQLGQWHSMGAQYEHLTMNVNLSAKQFTQKDLVPTVAKILEDTKAAPENLHLELTESSIFRKDAETLSLIHQLRNLGSKMYLDDFGAGYSSLQYLNYFPLSGLKIDRAFTQKIPVSQETQAIVRSVILMAQSLKMNVVVEGIENYQQIQYLRKFSNIAGQGFLFSKPLPAHDATEYLKDPHFKVREHLARFR